MTNKEMTKHIVLNAQEFVDMLWNTDYRFYCEVLDRLSDANPQATGTWDRDDEGNMIMLLADKVSVSIAGDEDE